MERLEFDLVVIGTGIAGLSAAIAAAEEGRSVAVLSKEAAPEECNTRYAQGGIVARGDDDSPAAAGRGHHGGRRPGRLPRGGGPARGRRARPWSRSCW